MFLHGRCIPQQNSHWQFWASVWRHFHSVAVRVCIYIYNVHHSIHSISWRTIRALGVSAATNPKLPQGIFGWWFQIAVSLAFVAGKTVSRWPVFLKGVQSPTSCSIIAGWWFGTWILCSMIYGIILPNWLSYFSRWLKPPTSIASHRHISWFTCLLWYIPNLPKDRTVVNPNHHPGDQSTIQYFS